MVQLSFTSHVGVLHVAPIEQFPDDKWEQVIAVNLSAAFHTSCSRNEGKRCAKIPE